MTPLTAGLFPLDCPSPDIVGVHRYFLPPDTCLQLQDVGLIVLILRGVQVSPCVETSSATAVACTRRTMVVVVMLVRGGSGA